MATNTNEARLVDQAFGDCPAQTKARTAGPWSADWYGLKYCVVRDTGDDHPARCTERLPQKFATLSEARAAAEEANRAEAGAL